MKWITRERPKIDRVACPWLIARFVDDVAEFLFVRAEQVQSQAEAIGAIPYDQRNRSAMVLQTSHSSSQSIRKRDLKSTSAEQNQDKLISHTQPQIFNSPEPVVILGAALIGLLIYPFVRA